MPVPLVLVAVGLIVSFVPGVPGYQVDPELLGLLSTLDRAQEAAQDVLLEPRRGGDPTRPSPERGRRRQERRRDVVAAQRDVLRRLRDDGDLDETVMRRGCASWTSRTRRSPAPG